jgi:GWxTD domain-containing protein
LLLWVDPAGKVEEARIGSTSGVTALDRAGIATTPYLTFRPAYHQGVAVGSWVQFDVVFEPSPADDADTPLPRVAPVDQPAAPEVREPNVVPEWMRSDEPLAPPDESVQIDLLREALGDDRDVERRWGSLEGLLSGEAPETALPLRWRDEAAEALEQAIIRDPENPAPFLALGRIRQRQGLRRDARLLFERGIDRAERAGGMVPTIVAADLYYELGRILSEDWLPWADLGQVHSIALESSRCSRAASRELATTHASSGTLVAWNYLCPSAFDVLMREEFEDLESLKHGIRDDMLRSYLAAVEASPGHVGANVEVLLDLADAGAFEELLDGARRFALASGGHPNALLLTGLALHRLGRSAEAQTQFTLALQRMTPQEVGEIRDIGPLLGSRGSPAFAPITARERVEQERAFWASLDPLLATPENEREIEHLARATYAHLRFQSAASDAGRVWIRYGRPHRVRAVRDGAGLRTVFWDYGPGPDVTFRRPATTLSFELTSEGQAYVDELLEVFPHRYDAGRGRVLSIVSQTARFRGTDGTVPEIELHAEVPPELATGETDSLDVGLYLSGPEGERWVVTRRRVAATNEAIHLSAVPTPTSDQVILELFHTTSNRAARLELPVTAAGPSPVGPALSDLLLVDPISPYSPSDAHRSSSLVEARTSPGFDRGGRGGLLFEVYDLPGRTVEYGLRATVEHLRTGAVVPVPTKPAGELEFQQEWTRSRRGSSVLPEYVTADFSSLDPGEYLVRLTVDTDTGGGPLEATRAIDIR